jgi:hypothetical protein
MHDVSAAWERLVRAGVPYGDGGPARPELDEVAEVAAAVREVLGTRDALDERQRTSLLAWLRAWWSAFPTSFREAFGADVDAVLERAAEGVDDADRYLKLRRIAREKLGRVL